VVSFLLVPSCKPSPVSCSPLPHTFFITCLMVFQKKGLDLIRSRHLAKYQSGILIGDP
jgi:hypothetical protein